MNNIRIFSVALGALVLGGVLLLIPVTSDAHGGRGYGHRGHHGHGGHFAHSGRHGYRVRHRFRHGHRGRFRGRWGHGHHSSLWLSFPIVTAPAHVHEPALEVIAPPPPEVAESAADDCQQTREFQTKIVIDGQVVPAYGTACLMPDGTWRQLGLSH